MGNSQHKIQTGREVESFHDKFKKVEVLQNNDQMILTIPYQQKQDIADWEKLLKTVKQCDPEFLLMPKKYMIAEQGICGSSGLIKIVYDSFIFSFEEEIKNHAQKFKFFEEPQIWYLLFAIISSVKEMDRLSIKVGDIRPYNIFVNENGQVKLSGVYSWPSQLENFLKTSYDKTVTYLAPEELNQCRMGQKGKKSHIAGQSFSVGLTLLHTCLLKPMNELYNLKKFQFDAEKLQQEIKELRSLTFWNEEQQKQQKYSESLISVIIGLLNLNQASRLTSLQILDQLQPHAEEILNLRQFQMPNFKIKTPAKNTVSQVKKAQDPSNGGLSPQYSSIQRKEYNQPQSLGFEATYNFVIPSRTTPNYSAAERLTPVKNRKSKEKLEISLSKDKKNAGSKTNQPSRQNLSRQKVATNLNPSLTSVGKTGPYPVESHYPAEFKIGQNQFESYRPLLGSTIPAPIQTLEKKFQVPVTFNNQPVSNYTSYQPKFQVPPATQYRTVTQQPTYYYQQVQTSYTYKPTVAQNQPSQVPGSNNYPFSRNVDLTTSGYTFVENNKSFGLEKEKVSFGITAQQATYVQNTSVNYQTSTVKPLVPGQSSFTSSYGNSNPLQTRPLTGAASDLLKKIDQQLNKSKQMYPTGTII